MPEKAIPLCPLGQFLEEFWIAATEDISGQITPFDARDLKEEEIIFKNTFANPGWEEILTRVVKTREDARETVKNQLRSIKNSRITYGVSPRPEFNSNMVLQAFGLSLLQILIFSALDPGKMRSPEDPRSASIPGLPAHLHIIARFWKQIKAKNKDARGITAEEVAGLRALLASSEIIDVDNLIEFLQDPEKIGEAIVQRQYR